MEKISIILPCYGVEKYVEEAYRSIGESERFEIIFIIDGSPDKTEEIVRNITTGDGRVKIISRTNEGYFNTVVEGFQNASHNWIKILEPDDMLETNFFNELVLDEENCKVIYTKVEAFNNDKRWIINQFPFEQDKLERIPFIHGFVFHKSTLARLQKVAPPRFSFSDAMIVAEALNNSDKVNFIDKVNYKYRVGHEGQSTSKANILKTLNNYEEVLRCARELRINDNNWSKICEAFYLLDLFYVNVRNSYSLKNVKQIKKKYSISIKGAFSWKMKIMFFFCLYIPFFYKTMCFTNLNKKLFKESC